MELILNNNGDDGKALSLLNNPFASAMDIDCIINSNYSNNIKHDPDFFTNLKKDFNEILDEINEINHEFNSMNDHEKQNVIDKSIELGIDDDLYEAMRFGGNYYEGKVNIMDEINLEEGRDEKLLNEIEGEGEEKMAPQIEGEEKKEQNVEAKNGNCKMKAREKNGGKSKRKGGKSKRRAGKRRGRGGKGGKRGGRGGKGGKGGGRGGKGGKR